MESSARLLLIAFEALKHYSYLNFKGQQFRDADLTVFLTFNCCHIITLPLNCTFYDLHRLIYIYRFRLSIMLSKVMVVSSS